MILYLPPLIDLNAYIRQERTNRYIAANTKKELTNLVAIEAKVQKIGKLDKIRKLTFVWRHKNKRMDKDNLHIGVKFILDGLVKAGVIKADSWGYTPNIFHHKHRINKDNPGVTVLIK